MGRADFFEGCTKGNIFEIGRTKAFYNGKMLLGRFL